MTKSFALILFLFPLLGNTLFSQKVELSLAKKVAQIRFQYSNQRNDVPIESMVVFKNDIDTLFYLFTFKNKGFIIVSGDQCTPPILGECKRGIYNPEIMPDGLLYLLEKYKYSIYQLKQKKVIPSERYKNLWKEIISSDYLNSKSYVIGDSLVKTEWDQVNGYAYYCPPNCPAGCTATAMAQILRYWECKVNGEINDYHWREMDFASPDLDNALLIYDCGIASDTDYDPDGSTTTPWKARDGFVDYFNISNSADVKWRIWHLNNWEEMLKDEIDLERPILYSGGQLFGGGHSWVVDGYNDLDNFHCNWGWNGLYNGFYALGDFDPGNEGPFNEWESGIFNVVPEPHTISGSQLVCSSGSSYYLSNVSSFDTIVWTTGPNLILSSAQGSNPCVFYSNGTGSSWIRATINTACGPIFVPDYLVWTGPPEVTVTGPESGYTYNSYIFYANPTSQYSDPTSYQWILNPLNGNSVYTSSNYADISFYNPYDCYQVIARSQNICGLGDYSLTNISISDYSEGSILYPNPADDYVTVSIEKLGSKIFAEQNITTGEESISYYVQVFDLNGVLFYKKKVTTSIFTLSTKILKDGHYIIKVSDDKSAFNLQLLVKH